MSTRASTLAGELARLLKGPDAFTLMFVYSNGEEPPVEFALWGVGDDYLGVENKESGQRSLIALEHIQRIEVDYH